MNYSTILTAILLTILFSQCERKTESGSQTPAVNEIAETESGIRDGWARPAKAGRMSAAYFTLVNGTATADTLIGARSDAAINTEVHLSFMNDEGLMAMEEQEMVPVPAGTSLEFKQGGLHIMLIQPEKDLVEGDSVRITLEFVSGQELKGIVPVKMQGM